MTASRWLPPVAVGAALIVWLAAPELALPARVFTALLVGLLPPLLLVQAGISDDDIRDRPVAPAYVSSMFLIWALGIAALWVGRASGFTRADMGLVPAPPVVMLGWTAATLIAALGVVVLARALGWRETPLVEWLLPRSVTERVLFALLSLSAGVGEELAFRGFLIPALERATGSLAMAVIVSSAAFGMMHSYQRVSGTLRASVLGALLAAPFLVTGSLYASMLAHAAFDLIVGLVLADWLLRAGRHGSADPGRKH